jgi:conjugative transfer region lipoprotein (TIGR03751 family)
MGERLITMQTTKRLLTLISALLLLGGCTTNKQEMFPHDADQTMMDIWRASGGGSQELIDARSQLRRRIDDTVDIQTPYSRDSVNEIFSQFKRLPNPDLVMYVYPHLAGTDPVPVPGYTTIFPMFNKVKYAMPGERTEDY